MSDLISRSALLKRLNEYVFDAFNCDGIDGESVLEYQQTHDDNSTYIIQGFNDVYELLEDIPTVDAVPVRDIEKAIDNIGIIARASNNTNFINGCTASLNELYKALTPQKVDGKKVQE